MDNSLSTESAACHLTAKASLLTNRLIIEYELVNTSGETLYLFNQLAKRGGESVFETDPNTANVVLDANRIVVSKAIVSVPPDTEVERLYTPCLSHVEPRATYRERFELSVPLSPFTWYQGRPKTKNPRELPLYFGLGYVIAQPAFEAGVQLVETSYGPKLYRETAFEQQQLVMAGPLLERAAIFTER